MASPATISAFEEFPLPVFAEQYDFVGFDPTHHLLSGFRLGQYDIFLTRDVDAVDDTDGRIEFIEISEIPSLKIGYLSF
ncbi:hypothetical protein BRC72_11555 [Halobacteriales archaeon QH_7_66_36]|nr:MAG: hypothetical protein BRC72_11555 [Halobacteriales archaeon QH_7_66_36]